MADRFRDFGTPEGPTEPITFKLAGEEFKCLPVAPAGVLNDLIAGIGMDESGNRIYSAPNLVRFVTGVLIEHEEVPDPNWEPPAGEDSYPAVSPPMVLVETDDVQRFLDLMRDKDRPVPVETLGEIVTWLSELYSGRPTRSSRRSQPGRR